MIYLIGSLRNARVREVAAGLRDLGLEVFDDWHGAGPDADDHWQRYEAERGRTFIEALRGENARHTFGYDYHHLMEADAGVLVLPAGKSGHLELGFLSGRGVNTAIILDGEPERWDVMYRFARDVFPSIDAYLEAVRATIEPEEVT